MTKLEIDFNQEFEIIHHKFIVGTRDNNLIYSAGLKPVRHKDIGQIGGIKLLGGGEVESYDKNTLRILGTSGDFGPVPKEIIEGNLSIILEAYQKVDPIITNIITDLRLASEWESCGWPLSEYLHKWLPYLDSTKSTQGVK